MNEQAQREMTTTLHALLEYVVKNKFRRYGNQYAQKPVRDALIVLCKATGHSHAGYDWLDIVDILNGEEP